MNCEEFENLLHSLVTGRLLDTAQQNKALGHVESCSRCSSRLQNERLLATGLKALAAEPWEKQAPPRVEKKLLEAFRVHKTSLIQRTGPGVKVPYDKGIRVSGFSGLRTGRPKGRGWLIGVAASALLLAAVGFIQWRVRHIQPGITPIPRVNASKNPAPYPAVGGALGTIRTVDPQPISVPKVEKSSHARRTQNPNLHKTGKQVPSSTSKEEIGRREIDTNFLPMMAASPLEPTESGHLIRMNLPRSTMGRFGFPINSERSEEPIKADVLIGEDGVARAIRFVYTAENIRSSDR